MSHLRAVITGVVLALLAPSGLLGLPGAEPSSPPPVAAPPDSFFEKVRERDREAARGFYKKHLEVGGLSVAASGEVADLALQRTHHIVSHLLAGRADVLAAMVKDGMYLIVIGKDQVYTDMPEHRESRDPEFMNERVRGTGGKPTSFGEENLLSLPLDRYDDESIGVHEFCHTIDGALRRIDTGWRERRDAVYQNARDRGLYRDAYAASNPGEYWAEICQSYFDCNRINNWNHGPVGTREELKVYDPEGYELVRSTFNLGPAQDWRYSFLVRQPAVGPPPAKLGVDPYYTKFTWAREFTVLGREASDEALLEANHTIRRTFAYRHDLLKALMAAGVRLAVLGRGETIADLPEYRDGKVKGADLSARFLEYSPETPLLVVGEEDVLAGRGGPRRGRCLLMSVLANAVYQVAAKRPVDPDWESRPERRRQQYELRVVRVDARFDEKLAKLHAAALEKGLWKGTPAARDHAGYWVTGVLAWFDALGGEAPPAGAPGPVATREALRAYDPDLHALIEETLAWRGKPDWRRGW